MRENFDIRLTTPADTAAIEELYRAAFPDEDLLPLVHDLLYSGDEVVSIVALDDGRISGHAGFTYCTVEGGDEKVALLAPLAVTPMHQLRGIGRKLVEAGCDMLVEAGVGHVFVLGDPGYYGRLGFVAAENVTPPYDLPEEWQGAWQVLEIGIANTKPKGRMAVPKLWQNEALWR